MVGALFAWTAELAIDHGAIDAQHRQLLRLFGELKEAMGRGQGRARLHRTFAKLAKHLPAHFATEECLMKDCGYPLLQNHRAEHQRALKVVEKLDEDFKKGDLRVCTEMLERAHQWFRSHVAIADQQYWEFKELMEGYRRRLRGEGHG
jgi:hemerythrin-like metal-binding protein